MFVFDEMIREVDIGLIKAFGVPVRIDHDVGSSTTLGIFDNPASLSAMADGGWVADTDPELFILEDEHTRQTKTRDRVEINMKTGKQKFQVIRPPQRDSAGMLKLVLGVLGDDSGNKIRRSISY
jgi:hypothetical protein